jgi:hypothetical protein
MPYPVLPYFPHYLGPLTTPLVERQVEISLTFPTSSLPLLSSYKTPYSTPIVLHSLERKGKVSFSPFQNLVIPAMATKLFKCFLFI